MTAAHDLEAQTLAEAMAAHGLTPPDHIEPGRIVRFPAAGKGASNRSAWCKLFDDGEGAVFGVWSTGLCETWQARRPTSKAEQQRWREQIEHARAAAEQERAAARQEAAENAADRWAAASPADPLHGYLIAKGIEPHGLRQDGDRLLIPLHDGQGEIRSLQRIDTAGNKRFFPGGEVTGNCYVIGDPGPVLVVAEGFATAATIHQATGHPVAVAFNAGNLQPVAEALSRKYPDARLIIAADDDQHTEGNPGLSKARSAAAAVYGEVVAPGQAGDFNDLAAEQGPDAVRQRFEQPERPKSPAGFALVRAGELKPRPHDWLINGLFESDALVQFFGPPGGAKTFTLLDIACSIAAGTDYHGRRVKQGPVILIAGEGFNGLARRLRALRIVRRVDMDQAPLFVSTMPAALLDPVNLAAVLAAINATGCSPALVIVDTLARNFGPGDENSTQDMGQFIAACDQLRSAYGCTVALVHHTGHGDQQRGRGSSVLSGAIDSAFRITREPSGPVLIECTKQKDAPPPEPFAFKFQTVELGFSNDDGTPATSAVLAPCDVPTAAPKPAGKHQARALEILHQLMETEAADLKRQGLRPEQARVRRDDWRQACIDDGMHPPRFHEAEKAMKERALIHQEFAWVRPICS